MSSHDLPGAPRKRVRGRPRSNDKLRVVDQLLAAAESLLHDCSHYELTERRIATEAGVDEAMIRYYFGDKEGLIFDLVMRCSDEVGQHLKALDAVNPDTRSPTLRIFSVLADNYHTKPWIMRIMVSELTRMDSGIRQRFILRYGQRGLALMPLQRTIERLIDAGVYRQGIDAGLTALSMMSIITAPVMLGPLAGDVDNTLHRFKNDAWLRYVTELFDAKLSAATDTIATPTAAAAVIKRPDDARPPSRGC